MTDEKINEGDIVVSAANPTGDEWDIGVVMDSESPEIRVYWLKAQCAYLEDPSELEVRAYPRRLLERIYKAAPCPDPHHESAECPSCGAE